MIKKPEILSCLNYLIKGFPTFKPEAGTIEAYVEDLSDLEPNILLESCKILRKQSSFFPSIAAIREQAQAIKNTRDQERGVDEEKQAFENLRERAKRGDMDAAYHVWLKTGEDLRTWKP